MATQDPDDEQRLDPNDINGTDSTETSPDAPEEMGLMLIAEQADASIRRVWHDGRWFFSVIDVIGVLTDAPTPRVYWGVVKHRLQQEGAREVFTHCKQLKMRA